MVGNSSVAGVGSVWWWFIVFEMTWTFTKLLTNLFKATILVNVKGSKMSGLRMDVSSSVIYVVIYYL